MADTVHCENCGGTWPEEVLDPIHDYWSRVDPGGVVPLGQCPDPDCGALCYPSYGYVYEVEQRLSAMQDVLTRLLSWAESMGGWEKRLCGMRRAACWRLLAPMSRTHKRRGLLMQKIFVAYTNGIEHPTFWALCGRCQRQHGPYTQFAAIEWLCPACRDEDLTRLHAYIERLLATR